MSARFVPLETVTRRAPLGLRFLDLARGVGVTDGLEVTARPVGAAGRWYSALRSRLSGVYGFHSLPGLRPFEVGELDAAHCVLPRPARRPTGNRWRRRTCWTWTGSVSCCTPAR